MAQGGDAAVQLSVVSASFHPSMPVQARDVAMNAMTWSPRFLASAGRRFLDQLPRLRPLSCD